MNTVTLIRFRFFSISPVFLPTAALCKKPPLLRGPGILFLLFPVVDMEHFVSLLVEKTLIEDSTLGLSSECLMLIILSAS